MASAPHDRHDGPPVSREEFAVFAHELRGALTVISGYSDILRRPLHDDDRVAALDGIRRAVQRADALCSAVLAGEPVRTQAAVPRSPLRLWALAEHVAAEQRAATGRTVVVEAPDDAAVVGDEQALARVLSNLVSNAAKYSPAESVVTIRVASEVSQSMGNIAVLEVSDRGSGIPSEDHERLFEPFERLDRDAELPGTGLGLSIVASVVGAHGGTARILDRPGGGTTVRIELPLTH
ncbi:MAG: HAMP domain-containing histidine kinase [Coriobacteriia bacterium]|nr:HAMP domain-containing histidine kinase [Coriobacteriia bacterium]